MQWDAIETAPKDGTRILVVVKPWKPKEMQEHLDKAKVDIRVLRLARYSTWDSCWRDATSGEMFVGMEWWVPTHWAPVPGLPE